MCHRCADDARLHEYVRRRPRMLRHTNKKYNRTNDYYVERHGAHDNTHTHTQCEERQRIRPFWHLLCFSFSSFISCSRMIHSHNLLTVSLYSTRTIYAERTNYVQNSRAGTDLAAATRLSFAKECHACALQLRP